MRLPFAVLMVLLGALLSAQGPEQLPQPDLDTATVVAVSPADTIQLRDGQQVEFEVLIHYSLRSTDRAVLAVYAERYASGGPVCDNSVVHHTEGGAPILLKRGDGDVKARFQWHETPTSGVPRGAASLAIGMNLWTEKDGQPVKPVLRGFPPSFCRTIEP